MVKSLIQKQLPPVASFTMLALVLFAYFFAGSAPSPTFVVLQHQWQFSASLLTVAFGVYSISLLVALIFFGALSDYIGRRPVIFVALIIQAGSMAMFVFANNIQGLIEARIVQGFATGIASGALAAAVVEAAIQNLAPRVQKHERAGLFTAIFTVCYLALSIPAMLTGLLVKPFGLRLAVECHIGLLILTATLGLVLQMKSLKDLNQFNK